MNSNDEVVRVIESGQIVKLERSAKNVWESRKVEPCSGKENFRSIPHPPSSEPVHYQSSSPNCVSGIGSAHMCHYQPLRRNKPKRTPGQFIQISEITPNNIIRFLS